MPPDDVYRPFSRSFIVVGYSGYVHIVRLFTMKIYCFLLIALGLLFNCIAISYGTTAKDNNANNVVHVKTATTKSLDDNVVLSVVKSLAEFASSGFKSMISLIPFACRL